MLTALPRKPAGRAALAAGLLALSLASCAEADDTPSTPQASQPTALAPAGPGAGPSGSDGWYAEGQQAVRDLVAEQRITSQARNLILFVGDGMGISTLTAARILEGQMRGETGEENRLSFETFPHSALSKTYNTNQQTSDSAGTATAMLTGVKAKAGVIGVNQNSRRSDCASSQGTEALSIMALAELAGKRTGIVTTARLTHATPAAAYAHSPERGWEDDSDLPAQSNCKDIASQLINFPHGDGIDVAMGGGRRHFLSNQHPDPEQSFRTGYRRDGRDLVEEWQNKHPQGSYVWNAEQFAQLEQTQPSQVLGLFNHSHMQFETDRSRDPGGEPSLAQMTATAIKLLSQRGDQGFVLLVEGGRVDHAHHAGNAYRALTDAIALSDAVRTARSMTSENDTLIMVTADHSHVFTMAGYPTRGNPILGVVIGNDQHGAPNDSPDTDASGMPYTTVGYANGPGFGSLHDAPHADAGRANLDQVDPEHPDFRQESLVRMASETHGGEDVAIYASGPWAHLVRGSLEQHVIFHIMDYAGQVSNAARKRHPEFFGAGGGDATSSLVAAR